MRIALLAPLVSPIAPPYLGGAQALLADLAAGLAARGHVVTLYAAPGSAVPAVMVRPVPLDGLTLHPARFTTSESTTDPEHDPALAAANAAFARAFALVAAHADEHDLLHAHAFDWAAYAYASRQPLPVLHTLHLPPLDATIRQVLASVAPPPPARASARLVTVSHACAAHYAPTYHITDVVHNGLAVERIPFAAHPAAEGYLLFAGRISPEKGVGDALTIAERAGHPLLLAGGIYDQDYFRARVAPRLAHAEGRATYLGPLDRARVWELMAGATAALCPIKWEEPFGLVACEAQAAGAPVIGYARGALPEVVADGQTGVLVAPGDVEAAARAVATARTLDRRACRARIASQFSLEAMLAAYESLYAEMLAQPSSDSARGAL